jgi:hypothetical protein
MLASSALARHRARVVLLAVLVGVVGAITLSAAAGARRTDTALARFNTWSRSAQLEIFAGDASAKQLAEFGRLKDVVAFAPLRAGGEEFPTAPQLNAVASAYDTRFGTVVDRPRLMRGRLANPDAVDEVDVDETLAAAAHLKVGSHLDALTFSPAQVQQFEAGEFTGQPGDGPRVRAEVVGIVRRPLDLGDRGATGGVLIFTPAFTQHYLTTIGTFNGTVLRVRTRGGARGTHAVEAAARQIFGSSPQFGFTDLSVDTQGAQNAIDVLTIALWIFAGVAAAAGTVVLATVVQREVSTRAADQDVESALGVTRRQRVGVAVAQVLPVALGGAALAVIGAVLASPLFPIGVAGRAEPDPGIHIDPAVLLLGATGLVVVMLAIGLIAGARATRSRRADSVVPTRASRALESASRAGVGPAATTGVRMALQRGRGSQSVPVRSAVVGATLGIVGVIVALVFVASLDGLASAPRRSGWTWEFAAIPDSQDLAGPHSALLHEPGVGAVALLLSGNIVVDGQGVIAWQYTPLRGSIGPEIVAGRAPHEPDEVALGGSTLGSLHAQIGDRVRAQGPDGSRTYRVVGQAVFARIDAPQPLASGAAFSDHGLDALISPTNNNVGSAYMVVDPRPGTTLAALRRELVNTPNLERPIRPTVPVEVARLQQVGWLPRTLGALLALLALVAVSHALLANVRRRRRDLAVLKTLGFDRSQVRATVAWQATTFAVAGLVVGVPAGLVAGRLVWKAVADGLGVGTGWTVPVAAVVVAVAVALVAVILVALVPGDNAARTRPAVTLRSE